MSSWSKVKAVQKTGQETSQLVEVIRTGGIDIVSDLNFRTFGDRRNAKNDHRNIFAQLGALTDASGGHDNIDLRATETDQNQVGALALGSGYRVILVSGRVHTVAICLQQLFYSVTGLLYVFHHEDQRAALVWVGHEL